MNSWVEGSEQSFNPCFIGTYSFTKRKNRLGGITSVVLILVLLELILLLVTPKHIEITSL